MIAFLLTRIWSDDGELATHPLGLSRNPEGGEGRRDADEGDSWFGPSLVGQETPCWGMGLAPSIHHGISGECM